MIPSRHRADEFSLNIRYKHRADADAEARADAALDAVERSRGAGVDVIPGFYLTAGFANEGEAHWIATEHDALLSPAQIGDILAYIAGRVFDPVDKGTGNELATAGKDIANFGVDELRGWLSALEQQRDKLDAAIPKLRAALEQSK